MSTRRSILRGLAAAPFATVPALAAGQPTAADPTFALIEKHKVAQSAFETAISVDDGDGPDVERASDAEQEARYDMHEVAPTTLAGIAAYVAYWQEYTMADRFMRHDIGWEAIPTIAEAMAALNPAAPSATLDL